MIHGTVGRFGLVIVMNNFGTVGIAMHKQRIGPGFLAQIDDIHAADIGDVGVRGQFGRLHRIV